MGKGGSFPLYQSIQTRTEYSVASDLEARRLREGFPQACPSSRGSWEQGRRSGPTKPVLHPDV